MVFALLAMALFFAALYLMTLGAVLLARIVLGPCEPVRRILAAISAASITALLPIFALALAHKAGPPPSESAVAFLVLFGVSIAIAWPVAHFATRRLDRLTQFDPQVFA